MVHGFAAGYAGKRRDFKAARFPIVQVGLSLLLSRTLRARDNGAADYDPLVARRFAPHNHADQPDIARPKLRFVRARRLSAAPLCRCSLEGSPYPGLAKLPLTAEDYLAWEERSPRKHEYLAGEIFAMVDASDVHVTITGNLFALLRAYVRGLLCWAYMADMKLRVETTDAFFYPDLLVTCAAANHAAAQFKRLSKSCSRKIKALWV